MSSWHDFETGRDYSVAEVASKCDRHISDGHVKAIEKKKQLVRLIADCGHMNLVWTPSNESGWGASPMNPRLWRTVDGRVIFARVLSRSCFLELPLLSLLSHCSG
jgi:hypothetical protein